MHIFDKILSCTKIIFKNVNYLQSIEARIL